MHGAFFTPASLLYGLEQASCLSVIPVPLLRSVIFVIVVVEVVALIHEVQSLMEHQLRFLLDSFRLRNAFKRSKGGGVKVTHLMVWCKPRLFIEEALQVRQLFLADCSIRHLDLGVLPVLEIVHGMCSQQPPLVG